MSTAVVFASKHGATAEIASRIGAGLGPDTPLFNLSDGAPDLTDFDTVVLGTAIYAGQPMKAMKDFAASADLTGKRIALFVGGMEPDPAKRASELAGAYPAELAGRAAATAFCGGRFQFAKMKAFERFIIKRVTKGKAAGDVDGIDDEAIARFVAELLAP